MTRFKLAAGLIFLAAAQVLNIQGAAHGDTDTVFLGLVGTVLALWIIYRALRDAP